MNGTNQDVCLMDELEKSHDPAVNSGAEKRKDGTAVTGLKGKNVPRSNSYTKHPTLRGSLNRFSHCIKYIRPQPPPPT